MARLLVAGLLIAATVATPLIAQSVAPQGRTMAGGQTMSRADIQARIQAQFARRDTDRDGFLTAEEMGGRKVVRQERRMANRAARGERAIVNEGRARDPNIAFDRIDLNRDGSLSRDEFARAREVRIEKRVMIGEGARSVAGSSDRSGRAGRGGGGMGQRMLKRADADRDGKVTLAEATAGALRRFDRIDGNRDGRVTPEERAAVRAQRRAMRAAG